MPYSPKRNLSASRFHVEMTRLAVALSVLIGVVLLLSMHGRV
jgi:hypothetical protein